MIDCFIETTYIYVCALLCFYYVKFYVHYHVNYCNAARALLHYRRYALKQMFNYYIIYERKIRVQPSLSLHLSTVSIAFS